MSSHHGRRDRLSQKRKTESKSQAAEWGDWSPWDWDFEEKCFVRERVNTLGEINIQKGNKAAETAPHEPRTAADPSQELGKPRLDQDYATGVDYRLEQGFQDNAPAREPTGGTASGMQPPRPSQFGSYANQDARPGYGSSFSDPNVSTLASLATSPIPVGRGYLSSVPLAGSYNPSSIGDISNKLNYVNLSRQPGYSSSLGPDLRSGNHSDLFVLHESPPGTMGAFEPHRSAVADRAYEEDQVEQDDLEEQDLFDIDEVNEPDGEQDEDGGRHLHDLPTNRVPDFTRQPNKISRRNIYSTDDPKLRKQPLYKAYRVQKSKEFRKGRVFKVLWTEPLGTADKTITSGTEQEHIQEAKFGEDSYTSVRRFVIVRCSEGHCTCVPILTYGKQGTTKSGVKPNDHTIIYTTSKPPALLPGEPVLIKKPIKMIPDNSRDKLRPESRLNYSKVYTVEHNIKICFIGKIDLNSEQQFFTDFKRTFDEP